MQRTDFQQVFLEAASEVLETMFFTGIEDENAEEPPAGRVSAHLEFRGSPSGRFGVQVPTEIGRAIAANFLSLDHVNEIQVCEVLCELSNMLCGSVLSRVEEGARFELMHPEIDQIEISWKERPDAVGYTFGLGEGSMTMWMSFQESITAHPHPLRRFLRTN